MTMIERAIIFAMDAHTGTTRKGKVRPYILHPLEVMTIVAGLTEDEEVIAAAVLHDTVEDADTTPKDIEQKFGKKVMELVMAESEDKMRFMSAKESWKARKQATVDNLGSLGKEAKMISLGDKLANLREIGQDYAVLGDALWDRFNQKDKTMHAWYYSSICELLEKEFGDIPAIREYKELLKLIFVDCKEREGEKNVIR